MIDAAATSLRAAERQPWPSIELLAADGSTVASDRVARTGNWIVVYVSADCAACQSLLELVKQVENAAPRMVIVVAGEPGTIATAAAHTPLSGLTWLADPTHALAARLRAESLPTVVGIHDRTVEWSVGGVLTSTSDVGTVLASWLAK